MNENKLVKAAAEKRLRDKGYVPASDIAAKMGVHIGTVYRWIADKEVVGVKLGNRRFILLMSVIKKIGVETARVYGFLPEANADVEVEVEQ